MECLPHSVLCWRFKLNKPQSLHPERKTFTQMMTICWDMWLWASQFASLGLSFLWYKIKISSQMILIIFPIWCNMYWVHDMRTYTFLIWCSFEIRLALQEMSQELGMGWLLVFNQHVAGALRLWHHQAVDVSRKPVSSLNLDIIPSRWKSNGSKLHKK